MDVEILKFVHRNSIHIPQGLWKSFGVQNFRCGYVTFLSLNKKVTKEVSQRGAELLAPASKAAPFGNPRRALVYPGGS